MSYPVQNVGLTSLHVDLQDDAKRLFRVGESRKLLRAEGQEAEGRLPPLDLKGVRLVEPLPAEEGQEAAGQQREEDDCGLQRRDMDLGIRYRSLELRAARMDLKIGSYGRCWGESVPFRRLEPDPG